MNKPLVLCIMGPTASGKTDLAIQLSTELNAEIISVDSALVYKGMDIGTAKPEPEILRQYPHHLIDIRDVTQPYSAADFSVDTQSLIDDITARGKTPILAGGTMLYFKSLLQGLAQLPKADADIRLSITERAEKLGWSELHKQLEKVDPESAQRINPNDPQRVQRALEVYEITGETLTHFWNLQKLHVKALNFTPVEAMIMPNDRKALHRRISDRFQSMLEKGFVSEVEHFKQRIDVNDNLPAMRSVGYRQVWSYLNSDYKYDEMIEKSVVATRQLAKRQMTWLRNKKHSEITLELTLEEGVDRLAAKILKFVKQFPD